MAFKGFTYQNLDARGNPDTVYDEAIVPLGTRAVDNEGNEWIFLEGVASVVAGDWVTYDGAFKAARLAGNAQGPVAIFKAAVVANKFGWAAIKGRITGTNADTTAADKPLFIDGTAGRVDDAVVVGDLVVGAFSAAADDDNKLTVHIFYPYVTDVLPAA